MVKYEIRKTSDKPVLVHSFWNSTNGVNENLEHVPTKEKIEEYMSFEDYEDFQEDDECENNNLIQFELYDYDCENKETINLENFLKYNHIDFENEVDWEDQPYITSAYGVNYKKYYINIRYILNDPTQEILKKLEKEGFSINELEGKE